MDEGGKMLHLDKKIIILITSIMILSVSIILGIKSMTSNDGQKKDLIDSIKNIKYYKEANQSRYIKYQKENLNLNNDLVVLYVNIGIDKDFYTDIKPSLRPGTKEILVNKFYVLQSDYIPNDLEEIDDEYQVGGKMLVSEAAASFNQMAKKAQQENLHIRAVSAYRSYDYQDNLYHRYVNRDGQTKADTYSARPGHSEHQTGLAVDVDNVTQTFDNFGNTEEALWMRANAYKYGFILRYTKENEFITGYQEEPWHYRYVGVQIASKMREENISSYEEYYFKYLDN